MWLLALFCLLFLGVVLVFVEKLVFSPIQYISTKIKADSMGIAYLSLPKVFTNETKRLVDAFSDMNKLTKWEEQNRYLAYIPVTFHWSENLNIKSEWGFTKSDWGVVYIILSDYMKFKDPKSKTGAKKKAPPKEGFVCHNPPSK